jgi:predicted ATPase
MITRFYANNFRSLESFEITFNEFGVLCGANGSGKSSVFDAIRLVRDLATGEALLGGEGDRDVRALEFTAWRDSHIQEFELDLTIDRRNFRYVIHLEQTHNDVKPRVCKETASCNDRSLFDRDLQGVNFRRSDGTVSGFPLDWRQAALAAIQPTKDRQDIELLQRALAGVLVLRPSPRLIQPESRGEAKTPGVQLESLLSWYRHLSQEQDWTDALRASLTDVWPDFRAFKQVDVGLQAKALQLRFEETTLFFHQLSDGEKALLSLYMIRAALETGAISTVLIDEPDNYVGLQELQPWVLALRELLDDRRQALLISHHPELLASATGAQGLFFWRESHSSPTRIGPLKVPGGMSPAEAIARGWAGHG